ncbi:MAG: hypothetical protein K1X71_18960 [Pirellulales bacterium]|nr:hypothetical protein [Pirellulales bacterium]
MRGSRGKAHRVRGNHWLAIILLAAVAVTAFFWSRREYRTQHVLRFRAGDIKGHRYELAEVLRTAAAQHGMQLQLSPSGGARQDLDDVAAGKVDLALISGDLRDDVSGVRQVANLTSEALHLFAKQELIDLGITSLKGKRIATGGPESGTSHLALRVLEFVGLQPGRDFENVAATPTEWWARIETDQPDAIFMLSPLPFRSGDELIRTGFKTCVSRC